jgi:hypothetical protein
MKRLRSIIFLIILFFSLNAGAQTSNSGTITKTGTTAAQFLKIGVDARASSMGGAFAAMTGDLSAMHWNPAGLAHHTGLEAMFVHNNWIADMDFNYFAFAFEIGGFGTLGFNLVSLTTPDDLVRTVEQPEGTGELFNAGDLALGLTFARQFTDRFSLGGTVKVVRQNIWHMNATSVAADIGALFVTPFNDVRIGASITNFGGNMRLSGRDVRFSNDPDLINQGNVEFVNALYETDAYALPLNFRVGIATELYQREGLRTTIGIDAQHPNDNSESVSGGAEMAFHETFFVRAGYSTLFRTDSEEGLTLGGGIHYRLWGGSTLVKIDYAYADFGLLDKVQRFSIGVKF